jgi:SAM-dependent methyltransferase
MNRAQHESDRFHREYYSTHSLFETGTWLEKPTSSVMEIGSVLSQRSAVRALDLGAGVGRNSIPFVRLFNPSSVVCDCVEILPDAVEILRQNAIAQGVADRITPICSHVAEYKIAPNTYDMVMAMSVLEHAYSAERIAEGVRMIQEGTRSGGFNCLSIATDLEETDMTTHEAVEPIIQARISAQDCSALLSRRYSEWEIQRLDYSAFKDKLIRDGKNIEGTARYCMVVARKPE